MKVFDSTSFVLPLPANHRFPMSKYQLLSERVKAELPEVEVLIAPAASRYAIERIHEATYVDKVFSGTLAPQQQRRIGFPWSKGLVERSRRSVGATMAASKAALVDGVSVNLAGGTHHAHADFGAGFCVFNDVAVAVEDVRKVGREKIAIIDCDVHQGDGTAKIFEDDPQTLTISIHGAQNFPFRKTKSNLDVALPNGAADDVYLQALRRALAVLEDFNPDMVFYVAGADPYEHDTLGHLKLSKEGLVLRDQTVLRTASRCNAPTVIVMGGGYATHIPDIVDIHFNTVRLALTSASAFNGTI